MIITQINKANKMKLPDTYLMSKFEGLRIDFYASLFTRDFKDKTSTCGLIADEFKNDLYYYYRKNVDIGTLRKLNTIKNKDPIYKAFDKKYLKERTTRMQILKIEKVIFTEYKSTYHNDQFMTYDDFKTIYIDRVGKFINETV